MYGCMNEDHAVVTSKVSRVDLSVYNYERIQVTNTVMTIYLFLEMICCTASVILFCYYTLLPYNLSLSLPLPNKTTLLLLLIIMNNTSHPARSIVDLHCFQLLNIHSISSQSLTVTLVKVQILDAILNNL